ncbi:hypothetical protein GSI_13190 [Ganoderma sinense ZZ0214-1]|uniref:Uncharacterized protein n=1 Tax=Ganoderma sinense ZZ0214-1 TaxID=1077348 RepID=A0A2G8RUW6_9APHY|nr:hypothetical protein GSI_13190 [Ganoderma sinense ZZ0214-1]
MALLTIPGSTRHTSSQSTSVHPNGQAKIAIRDVQRVYGAALEIPLDVYRRSGALARPRPSSMVTPKQVKMASDRWDAESVLEDIDTQWGTIPEGGALEGYGSD